MTKETASEWQVVKAFFEGLDRSDLSDNEKLEALIGFVVEGAQDWKYRTDDPSWRLVDDEAGMSDPTLLRMVANVKELIALDASMRRLGIHWKD